MTDVQSTEEDVGKRMLINFVLDRSGSMMSLRPETLNGFNKYIEEAVQEPGVEYLFTLTTFNGRAEIKHKLISLSDVPKLTAQNYIPEGSTALFDAVGYTLAQMEKEVRPTDSVLTVIYTDGEENSSSEWTREKLYNVITTKEKEGNWTFVYLGADQKAWSNAEAIGVAAGNTVAYTASAGNMGSVFSNLSRATITRSNSYIGGASASSSFFADAGQTVQDYDTEVLDSLGNNQAGTGVTTGNLGVAVQDQDKSLDDQADGNK